MIFRVFDIAVQYFENLCGIHATPLRERTGERVNADLPGFVIRKALCDPTPSGYGKAN